MLEALSSACDKKRRERKKERRTRKELVGDLWFAGAGESSQTGVVMFVPLRTWKKISGAVLDVVVACSVCWFTNTCLSWATEQRTIGFEIRSFFFYLPPITSPGLRAIQNIQIRFFHFFSCLPSFSVSIEATASFKKAFQSKSPISEEAIPAQAFGRIFLSICRSLEIRQRIHTWTPTRDSISLSMR